MDLDDPMSIAISEIFDDLNFEYEQFKSNCIPATPPTTNIDLHYPFNDVTITPSGASDQFVVPSWSGGDFIYDQNRCQSDHLLSQNSPISSNSHDPSSSSPILSQISTFSLPSVPTTTLPYYDSLSVSPSSSSPDLSPKPFQCNKSSSETESTCSSATSSSSSSSGDSPIILKAKKSRLDTELLQLFESSVFNSLLEDNFIRISFQDEALAVGSGLRQLELKKYHELARVVDQLHGNLSVIVNREEPTDKFQMAILHKHTEKLITAVKQITSFSSLCIHDQMELLKSRFIDLCIIKSLIFIEPKTRTIKINGQSISMEKCHMMNSEQFIKLTASVDPVFRTDTIINLLILLIFLLNPNISNVRSTFAVRKEYILTIHLVQKYLELRGFTFNQANYEIKNLICNLEDFLLLFNAKQKIQNIARRHLGYTSQLIAEMLDINGQHHHQQQPA